MMKIKIAYIGGGSKMWARIFMNDLALSDGLSGEIGLYDIDIESAKVNQKIGERINNNIDAKSKFDYVVYDEIGKCLDDATFVVLSILPGTFDEMESDVHTPEEYGIYQSVGDTVGPGGVLRAMRTVPIYEEFAKKIKEHCPNAWVLNFTNPMTICVKTLYDVFPEIKAFGCCHEVFHAQDFLCRVLEEEKGIKITRNDIYTDASGINHFTWISEAKYKDIYILNLIPNFMNKYYEEGFYEKEDRFQFKYDPFAYGNKVKMDLYKKYNVLGAAGDRHLVEFMNNNWYIKNPQMVKDYAYSLTTVDFRRVQQKERIEDSVMLASGLKDIKLLPSGEEAVDLMKAILGLKMKVSNINLPNYGQVPGLPYNSIVESNCIFSADSVKPIISKKLPDNVLNLVYQNSNNIDTLYEGIKRRDLNIIFTSFLNQPLLSNLSFDDAKELFIKMVIKTRKYLDKYYDLDKYIKK